RALAMGAPGIPVAIVPEPLAVGVDVRSVGVAREVTKVTTLRYRGGALHRLRSMRGDVAAADAAAVFLLVSAVPFLSVAWNQQGEREDNCEAYQCFHTGLPGRWSSWRANVRETTREGEATLRV